jgi:hypothetical protein
LGYITILNLSVPPDSSLAKMSSDNPTARLQADYPWIKTPMIAGAPMYPIAHAKLATEISKAGI